MKSFLLDKFCFSQTPVFIIKIALESRRIISSYFEIFKKRRLRKIRKFCVDAPSNSDWLSPVSSADRFKFYILRARTYNARKFTKLDRIHIKFIYSTLDKISTP